MTAIAVVSLIVVLEVLVFLVPDLPPAEPRPKAPGLRGVRSVIVLATVGEPVQKCGLGVQEDEVVAASNGVLGKSALKAPGFGHDVDGMLSFLVWAVSTTEGCVVLVEWSVSTELLIKKDRQPAWATVAHGSNIIPTYRAHTALGKSTVLRTVEEQTHRLLTQWSEANKK